MKVTYKAHMGDDLMVVNAARVSFAKESSLVPVGGCEILGETDRRLISYLAKHGHWTPFSHPQISLHIKAPMFVRAQLFKHKVGLTENEVSRRYVSDEPEFYMPTFRKASAEKKQGSGENLPPRDQIVLWEGYGMILEGLRQAYTLLLEAGVAPEQARSILPLSTYTEWYWTGSLAAFARIYKQRTDPHAQAETGEIAHEIGQIIEPLFPVSWAALTKSET